MVCTGIQPIVQIYWFQICISIYTHRISHQLFCTHSSTFGWRQTSVCPCDCPSSPVVCAQWTWLLVSHSLPIYTFKSTLLLVMLFPGMGSNTLCQTTNANTNTFISRWPNTNYTDKNTTTFRLSNTNTFIQFVKYQYKFQNVNLFCNIHPMIMLLTNFTTYYVLIFIIVNLQVLIVKVGRPMVCCDEAWLSTAIFRACNGQCHTKCVEL